MKTSPTPSFEFLNSTEYINLCPGEIKAKLFNPTYSLTLVKINVFTAVK